MGTRPNSSKRSRNPPSDPRGSRLDAVRNWENLAAESHYSSSELAAKCRVSLRTLQRYFQQHDIKLSSWLKELRLVRAYELLQERPEKISDIARELGFKQTSHFSREFKKHFGVRPSLFRRGRAPRKIPLPRTAPNSSSKQK